MHHEVFSSGDTKLWIAHLAKDHGGSGNTIGQRIWASSSALFAYIEANRELFANKHTLELGSGTGVCGIFASFFASSGEVTLSDQSAEALALCAQNIGLNEIGCGGRARVCELNWGSLQQSPTVAALNKERPEGFDSIIGSDLTYAHDLLEPLVDTLAALLGRGPTAFALLVHESRPWLRDFGDERFRVSRLRRFLQLARQAGLKCVVARVDANFLQAGNRNSNRPLSFIRITHIDDALTEEPTDANQPSYPKDLFPLFDGSDPDTDHFD